MPNYKELLGLIRRGHSPAQIVEKMNLPPSLLRRMMEGTRFRNALRLEEDVARALLSPQSAKVLHEVLTRLRELAEADAPETARRACATLLEEARAEMKADAEQLEKVTPPWMLLGPSRRREDI